MDVSEIGYPKSLERWLKLQAERLGEDESRRWAVLIAHRAAMRVLPEVWEWSLSKTARNRDVTPLPWLWLNTISGVAGTCPTPLIGIAADSAYAAAATIADAANVATAAAAATFATAAATADAATADAATFAAAAAATAVWERVRDDCAALVAGDDPNARRLWPGENPFQSKWDKAREDTLALGPDWQFWVDWYDRALMGQPQDWALLTKVALIPAKEWTKYRDDWIQNAEHINAMIAGIVEQQALSHEAARLKAENERLREHLRLVELRSHNQPPELVDGAPAARELTIVWGLLDEAQKELEETKPSRARLVAIGKALLAAAKAIAGYCLRLTDTGLQSGAKAVGTAGAATLAAYASGHGEQVRAFAASILAFARSLGP